MYIHIFYIHIPGEARHWVHLPSLSIGRVNVHMCGQVYIHVLACAHGDQRPTSDVFQSFPSSSSEAEYLTEPQVHRFCPASS